MTRNLPLVSGRPSPCARASQREIPPSERVGGWGQDKHCLDKTISYAQNILWTILVEICGCEATIPCEIQSMLHLQHCWQPVQTSIYTDSFCANCSDKCDLSYSSLESRMSVWWWLRLSRKLYKTYFLWHSGTTTEFCTNTFGTPMADHKMQSALAIMKP